MCALASHGYTASCITGCVKLQDGELISWKRLQQIAQGNTAVRCGITTRDPHYRRGQYSNEQIYKDRNYIMYTCKTENVKKRENDLLRLNNWERNIQTKSNAQNEPGFCYVILKK